MKRVKRTLLAAFLVALGAGLAARLGADEPKADGDLARKIDRLIDQLGDRKFRVREEAMKQLLAIGKPAVPALRAALERADADLQLRLRILLGKIASGVPFLLEDLRSKDPKVRLRAVQRLAQIEADAKQAIPALVKALKDADEEVRDAAIDALSAIDPENKAIADAAPRKASVNGKYAKLLRKIKVEADRQHYGDFSEYGMYTGTSHAGHVGLPPGYWVYVQPHWYIWGELKQK